MIKLTLQKKLFFIILFTFSFIISLNFLFTEWNFRKGFERYIIKEDSLNMLKIVPILEKVFARYGSFNIFLNNQFYWHDVVANSLIDHDKEYFLKDKFDGRREVTDMRHPDREISNHRDNRGMPLIERLTLLDKDRNIVISGIEQGGIILEKEIKYKGKSVGYLQLNKPSFGKDLGRPPIKHPPHVEYMRNHKYSLIALSFFSIIIAALFSVWLSGRLLKPLYNISEILRSLAKGSYSARININSQDELGILAKDINQLAKVLESNENYRRQWVADVSHDLRTPISVLRSQLEAIQDGVREFNDLSVSNMLKDVLYLQRIVDDLYELAMSDVGALTYKMDSMDLACLLENCFIDYKEKFHKKGIEFIYENTQSPVIIYGDEIRLMQLFSNILDNSLKYTFDNGKTKLCLYCDSLMAHVKISDSAPAMAEEDVPKIFDRFFRGDKSRNRDYGGSGLGLAISKSIAEAHNAVIKSSLSEFGGIEIEVIFKMEKV